MLVRNSDFNLARMMFGLSKTARLCAPTVMTDFILGMGLSATTQTALWL